ncbi:thrombospondin type 3 repeat-containing protein [Pontiella desulfatans]|nr:thrombospondin type 3 repeat-containing protein [Pontiella desulfatans]
MVYGFSFFAIAVQAAVLSVGNGTVFSVNETVSANQVLVDSGAVLSGDGALTGNLLLKGSLKPGGGAVGIFTVQSNLVCDGGIFELHAVSNTVADTVDVSGMVGGSGLVLLSAIAGVSPQGLAVVLGGAGSDYSGLSVSPGWLIRQEADNLLVHELAHDDDDDGLTDYLETIHGTDLHSGDTDGDNFSDGFEVAHGYNPTNSHNAMVDFIRNNGGTFGLYESNVVVDVAVGQLALETSGGMADLSLQLMKSDDLTTWTNAAPPVEWSIPVEANQQFFRVRAEP